MAQELGPLAQSLGLEIGSGGVLGFATGYATKKIAKIMAFLMGTQIAFLKYLETQGVISVHWSELGGGSAGGNTTNTTNTTNSTASANATNSSSAGLFGDIGGGMADFLSSIPLGAAFTGGFLIGFKKA